LNGEKRNLFVKFNALCFREAQNLLCRLEISDQMLVDKSVARAVFRGIEDGNFQTEAMGGLGKHFAQLTSAEDTNRLSSHRG
jgi:hypothetical protein